MPSLFSQNTKIKKTGKTNNLKLFNFGIPAFETMSGKRTCPMAGPCADFCFARTKLYKMTSVKKAYEFRYATTQKASFVDIVNYEMQSIKSE